MKIGTVQLNYTIADVEKNTAKAMAAIRHCEDQGANLVVLTELLPTGYPPKDLLYREDLIDENLKARDALVAMTAGLKAAIAFGYVEHNDQPGGKGLFNTACIAENGKIVKVRRKVLLPTYDVFAEDRYFEPGENEDFSPVEIAGMRVGLVICEETWNGEKASKKLYKPDPVTETAKAGAQHIVVVNASPYRRGVVETRHKLIRDHCRRHKIGMTYVNQVGYNDSVGFDGDSFAMNADGDIIFHAPMFREDVSVHYTTQSAIPDMAWEREWQEEVLTALPTGINDFFDKNRIGGPAIVCNSGGIDSAKVLYLGTKARGRQNIISIALPSEFSTDHSLSDAEQLARTLEVKHITIPIRHIHEMFRAGLDLGFEQLYRDIPKDLLFGLPHVLTRDAGVTDENLQARVRGTIAMGYANRFSGLVLSTSNKSESAVGYTTLYGDMCGGLAVIGDVLKTDVYNMSNWLNETYRSEIIPWHTIKKLPSAELRPGQHDQQSLPPYELLDSVLRLVENYNSPRQIKRALINAEAEVDYLRKHDRSMQQDIEKVLRLLMGAEHKRQQGPTTLKISNKLFKDGWDMPIAHALRM